MIIRGGKTGLAHPCLLFEHTVVRSRAKEGLVVKASARR